MLQPDRLNNCVALITGGGPGIALAFARHGCEVAITSRTIALLGPTAAEWRALGLRPVAGVGDVRDRLTNEKTRAGAIAQCPLKRMGTVDDIANASRLFVTVAACVNGVTLVVDAASGSGCRA